MALNTTGTLGIKLAITANTAVCFLCNVSVVWVTKINSTVGVTRCEQEPEVGISRPMPQMTVVVVLQNARDDGVLRKGLLSAT